MESLSSSRMKSTLSPGRSTKDYKKSTMSNTPLNVMPTYKKYAQNVEMAWNDPTTRLKPSELSKPVIDIVADDYPMIIEFNNIKDNTCNVSSTVDIDQPIFQPSPKILVFENYAPFAVHEKKIYFRNNDSVRDIAITYIEILLQKCYIDRLQGDLNLFNQTLYFSKYLDQSWLMANQFNKVKLLQAWKFVSLLNLNHKRSKTIASILYALLNVRNSSSRSEQWDCDHFSIFRMKFTLVAVL